VAVNYTLPELHESTADASVSAIWRKWYPRLVLHEKGHSDLALKAAKAIEKAILAMDASSSCELLEGDANNLGAGLMAELRQLDKHYDETTSHGKSQGAQLSSWF
jgi:predicted secreted Zn-dependent protease